MSASVSLAVSITIGTLRLGADLRADLGAGHAGQHDVEHDQVRGDRSEPLDCGRPVGGALDREARGTQVDAHQLADVGLVVDDEHGGHEVSPIRMEERSRPV